MEEKIKRHHKDCKISFRAGYEVYDIEPDFARRRLLFNQGKDPVSAYYSMERMETKNYPVTKLFVRTGKYQGGAPILGEK